MWTAPLALLPPGEMSVGWPQLIPWGDQAAISYEIYPIDRVLEGKFAVRLLPGGESAKGIPGLYGPTKFSEDERKLMLEKRVKALWEYRIAGDYDKAFDMFDFAYKANTLKRQYLDSAGAITYLSYSVGDIVLTGNEASVKTKIKYEVKTAMLPSSGKPLNIPPVEVEAPSTWVWVANDWYLVYAPAFEPPLLKY